MKRAILILLLAGCASGEGEGPPPAEKCTQLRELRCARITDCLIAQGRLSQADRATALQLCRDAFTRDVDCGKVVGASDGYDRCVFELTGIGCAVLVPPMGAAQVPASCQGVLLLSR